MPEAPENSVILYRLHKAQLQHLQQMGCPLQGSMNHNINDSNLSLCAGHIRLVPRTFAMGTKQKHYCTTTVDRSEYCDELEPLDNCFRPNEYDAARSIGKAWSYLIDRPLKDGPLNVALRGKCLAIAAGYVSFSAFLP